MQAQLSALSRVLLCMRAAWLPRLITALLILWCACCVMPAAAQSADDRVSIAEQYLFQAANAERASLGLRQLQWSSELYRAADFHALQMAARRNISHQYAGEPELAERGKRAGVQFSRISENVAEAPTAIDIHDAWMHSAGHRENLLDARVDAIGIRVVRRGEELYAVEDFAHTVQSLSLDEQERSVGRELQQVAPSLAIQPATLDARMTCAMDRGFAGTARPLFVMRFTAGDLSRLPEQLLERLRSSRFGSATVGACRTTEQQPFTAYSIAVMLFR